MGLMGGGVEQGVVVQKSRVRMSDLLVMVLPGTLI